MQPQNSFKLTLILALACVARPISGADFQFRHHFIGRTLPVSDKLVSEYGLTALMDLDRDGDLDFVL